MAQSFPDYEKLYTAVTRADGLDVVYDVEKQRIQQLRDGLRLFCRPSADAAAKLKRNDPVPLVQAPPGYTGAAGKAGASWQEVSKLLVLHEGQAVLLLRRWIRSNAPNAKADWKPSQSDMHSICQSYFTQRWHLILLLRYFIDLSVDDMHPDQATAATILSDLGRHDLITSLLATASGTFASIGSAVGTTNSASQPEADGALLLRDAEHIIDWEEQAACELCCIQLCILSLLQTPAEPSPDGMQCFAHALLDHSLRPSVHVLDDTASMRSLAARLGIAIVISCLGCECVSCHHVVLTACIAMRASCISKYHAGLQSRA
jgi:hypothetical protein